jgi:CRP-like cAMP-binding protein
MKSGRLSRGKGNEDIGEGSSGDSSPEFALTCMYEYLHQQFGLSKASWEQFLPEMTVVHAETKCQLQEAGQLVTQFYFLVEGLVRFYYVTPDGKESNKAFYAENNIVGSLSALILNEPCRFTVETMESCTLVALPYEPKGDIWQVSSEWQYVFNRCCQLMLVRNERREAELLTLSAKQRYLQFVQNFPHYIDRIPQYHIASYLGVTPVALSKYKNQWISDT